MLVWLLFSLLFTASDCKRKLHLRFNYCSLNCPHKTHPACNCRRNSPREEILIDPTLIEFRKNILEQHNYYRFRVAAGEEYTVPSDYLPSANGMFLVNYDMELEHLARCHGIKRFHIEDQNDTGGNMCSISLRKWEVKQNIFGLQHYDGEHLTDLGAEDHWYGKGLQLINNSTIILNPDEGKDLAQFTLLLSFAVDRIGCVRIFNQENISTMRYCVICNYASSFGFPINTHGEQVYYAGEPCTSCLTGCVSRKYPKLCGIPKPVPEDGPTAGNLQIRKRNIFLIVMAVLSLVFLQ